MPLLRIVIAIVAAKLAMWLSRVLGRGKGSSLPGMVALKICPSLLQWFAGQPRYGILLVTGTNGKTTTSNMLAHILTNAGFSVLANREGANLMTGVVTAFTRSANLLGRVKCDYAVLEVDEAAFPSIFKLLRPQVVLLTNFFRDQLDRYGELDTTVRLVGEALQQNKATQLVLNADDPLVAQMQVKTGLGVLFYGLGGNVPSSFIGEDAREAKFCPFCGAYLQYTTYIYSQLGSYLCPGCGFKRPEPHLQASILRMQDYVFSGAVSYRDKTAILTVPAGGIHNYYNALSALGAAALLGVNIADGTTALRDYVPATGRMERFIHNHKPLLLNLVKNPAGFNQALAVLLRQDGIQDVLIAINDNDADGRDVSWLWDVDFEVLEEVQHRFNSFVCTGQRGEEMAVRLKYAGVSTAMIKVIRDMEEAVARVIAGEGSGAFFLATYTALWPLEKILARKAKRVESNAKSLSSVP